MAIVIPTESLFDYKNQEMVIKQSYDHGCLFSDSSTSYILNINKVNPRNRSFLSLESENLSYLEILGDLEINVNKTKLMAFYFVNYNNWQVPTVLLDNLTVNSNQEIYFELGSENGTSHYSFKNITISASKASIFITRQPDLENLVVNNVKQFIDRSIVLNHLPHLKKLDLSSVVAYHFQEEQYDGSISAIWEDDVLSPIEFKQVNPQCQVIFNKNAVFHLKYPLPALQKLALQMFTKSSTYEYCVDFIHLKTIKLADYFPVIDNKITTTVQEFKQRSLSILQNLARESYQDWSIVENVLKKEEI